MEKKIKISIVKKVLFSLVVIVSLGLLGCSGAGKAVPQDKQILFGETGKSGGTYEIGGCTVQYSYTLAGEKMSIKGGASYRSGVDSLDVRVQFLDGTGTVLEQRLVYSSGYRTSGKRGGSRGFHEDLVVPSGAAGIGFTCSVREYRGHK